MFNHLVKNHFPAVDIPDQQKSTTPPPPVLSSDTRLEIECKEFLPEAYDTWSFIEKLTTDTIRFRETYDLYKYERSESQQRHYFDQLKVLDDTIYKLSLTIHQRLQSLENLVRPSFENFHRSENDQQQLNTYTPAYIRIAQNQLNSLKSSFKRIIMQHNADSIEYQNDLKRSLENSRSIIGSYQEMSRATMKKMKTLFTDDQENTNVTPDASQEQIQLQVLEDKQQLDLTEQELQITDLEARLESVRILKERVRQMKQDFHFERKQQNELVDNIWLNTSSGSDYIAQSVDEFRLVKNLKQSKMNLWVKLLCITFCFLLLLVLILTFILILNQK